MGIEPKQLAELWQQHAAALRLLARTRFSRTASDWADDCVQEAFIALAKQARVPDDPLAWLARVVRNNAISRARSAQRRQQREKLVAKDSASWWDGGESFENELLGDDVQKALQELEPDTRDIIVAHLWTGMTFRQMADAFQIPSSTVHRIYANGIANLRSLLQVDSPSQKTK